MKRVRLNCFGVPDFITRKYENQYLLENSNVDDFFYTSL